MPVDRSTLDRAPAKPRIAGPPAPKNPAVRRILGPPAPPASVAAGGGGDFKKPYTPAVPAHDRAPLRDARVAQKAPYVSVLGHPGQRSTMSPKDQIHYTKQLQGGNLTPQQSTNLSHFLASLPHPADQLHLIGTAQQEGVLPPEAATIALGAAHKILGAAKGFGGVEALGKTNTLSSFPQLDSVTPQARAKLDAVVAQQGRSVPANATLSDYYKAIYGPKPDGWRGVVTNLPRDALLTPVYSAQGGFALGHAVGNAVLHGDTRDLKEIGAQQLDIVKHPGAFVQKYPFQTALMAIGGIKGAGRIGAIGRDLEATPRSVPILDPETKLPLEPVRGEVPTLERGTLSTRNLTTRAAQKLQDTVLAKSPRLQKQAMRSTLRDARAESRAQVNRDAAEPLKGFLDARGGVSRKEAQRIFENEARGITPQQHASYRGAEASDLPPLTPAQEALHASIVGLDKASIERGANLGILSDFSAQRRAYLPAIKVAAKEGDATAARFITADTEAQQLYKQLEDVNHPHAATLRAQYEALHEASDAALQTFAAKHAAAGAPEPAYVPEVPTKRVQSAFARPGGGAGIAAGRRRFAPRGEPYNARLFEAGTYQPITDDAIIQAHGLPGRLEQAFRFAAEVSNPERGIVKRAEPGEQIPPGYVLQRVTSRQSPLSSELAHTTGAAPATDPLHSLMSTFDLSRINDAARVGHEPTVPNGPGEYRLWPVAAYHQLEQMRSLNPPTGGALVAAQAGRVLRNALLYSRPAYPFTNVVSNVLQSGLVAGTGPSSYLHAKGIDENLIPPRVQDTGTAAVNFDAPGASSLKNAWEDRGSALGGVGRVAAHPFARYAQGIYHASVDLENWTRRATYLSKAIPEAQKMAHPEWGPIHRFVASWRPADAAVKQVLDDMAHNRTPEARAAAQRSVKVLNQALGDFAAMGDHRNFSVVVPFWRWTNFVRILMGHTLPVHYPGRALLLYRLGSLGQEAQHQMGNLTPSLQGAIPFAGGAISTQRINPFSTLGMNVMPGQGQTAIDPQRSISNLSPFAQMAYEVLAHKDPVTGTDLTNQYGLPPSGGDYARIIGSQAAGLIPPLRAVAPLYGGGKTGAPDTSIDVPGLVQQGPHRAGPQQPDQSVWQQALNQVLPVSYRKVDLQQMALQGDKKLRATLKTAFREHAKADVEKIMGRLASERGVDLTKATPARTHLIIDAVNEWKKTR